MGDKEKEAFMVTTKTALEGCCCEVMDVAFDHGAVFIDHNPSPSCLAIGDNLDAFEVKFCFHCGMRIKLKEAE